MTNTYIYDIVERYLGYRMNLWQREAIDGIMNAEPGQLVSIAVARRSGKTTLARALMKYITASVTVVKQYDMHRNYEPELLDRIFAGNADITRTRAWLVIFDEVDDMSYIEHLRQNMRETKFLQLYTPHEQIHRHEFESLHDVTEPFRYWTQETTVPTREEMNSRAVEFMNAVFKDELVKNKDKEWDEEENSE